ncbi:unnamed protein product [Ambrosiozyma monospora]|uniref:Unnamed protein product n=1 Tax=Ambrosiozyma monospora TaxID=43982 RepID=A0ACB5U9E5_AMBMO|nr:unnamed protein product [Ambrosiozyma monospora]
MTISGGKWTTYREMAEEVSTKTIQNTPELKERFGSKPCLTKHYKVVGADNYDPSLFARLAQCYQLPEKLASHLAHNYGDRAPLIIQLFKSDPSLLKPLGLPKHASDATYTDFDHPFTFAELHYSLQYEYARHPVDFLARRCRLAFLDSKKALQCVDDVVDVMAKEFGWSSKVKEQKKHETVVFIQRMGVVPNADSYGTFY